MSDTKVPNQLGNDPLLADYENISSNLVSKIRIFLGIASVVAILAGLALLFATGGSLEVVAILIAISFLVSGIVYAGIGLFAKELGGGTRVLYVILGVLMVGAAWICFRDPETALLAMTFVIGFVWIFEGIVELVTSGSSLSKGWSIVFGIISIIAGIVIIVSPIEGTLALALAFGIILVISGIAGVVRAFQLGKYIKKTN